MRGQRESRHSEGESVVLGHCRSRVKAVRCPVEECEQALHAGSSVGEAFRSAHPVIRQRPGSGANGRIRQKPAYTLSAL